MLCVHNFNSLVLQLPAQNNSDQPEIVLIQTASIFFPWVKEKFCKRASDQTKKYVCLEQKRRKMHVVSAVCIDFLINAHKMYKES